MTDNPEAPQGSGEPSTQTSEPSTTATGGESTQGSGEQSSTGLQPNVAGTLCYLLGFLTGVVFLIIEKDSKFVRFHAMQSTIVFGGLFVLNIALNVVPVLGVLISLLLLPVSIILWILLMWKAFKGERFKLPVVGDIAENQI